MYPITFQECIEQSLRKQTLKFRKSPLRFRKSFKMDVRPLLFVRKLIPTGKKEKKAKKKFYKQNWTKIQDSKLRLEKQYASAEPWVERTRADST